MSDNFDLDDLDNLDLDDALEQILETQQKFSKRAKIKRAIYKAELQLQNEQDVHQETLVNLEFNSMLDACDMRLEAMLEALPEKKRKEASKLITNFNDNANKGFSNRMNGGTSSSKKDSTDFDSLWRDEK